MTDSNRLAVWCIAGALSACGTASEEHTFAARDYACADSATGASCSTDVPLASEAARTVALPHTLADTTRAYVVSEITLPEATGETGRRRAAGFNLDGLDVREPDDSTSDCTRRDEDFGSTSEDGVLGVDNAVQGFIRTIEGILSDCPGGTSRGCLDATLREQIDSGALVMLVEVSGINDYDYDDAVSVQVLLGQRIGDATPTLGADGRLASGQSYEPALDPDGAPLLLGPAYPGDIYQGRLRIHTDRLALSINTGVRQLDLTLIQAELRFDISETTLTNGMIGGALPNEAVIAAAVMVSPDAESLVRIAVEGASDIAPSSDPAVCTSLSVGITFQATSANLTR